MTSLFDTLGVELFGNIRRFDGKQVIIMVEFHDGYTREMTGKLRVTNTSGFGYTTRVQFIVTHRIFGPMDYECSWLDLRRATIRLCPGSIEEEYRDILGS